jgi:transposase-like protein
MKNQDAIVLRKEAVRLFLAGEKPTSICLKMGISRQWFYKWLKRYQSGNENWFADESRKPHANPQKISILLEQTVVKIRQTLSKRNYSQTGAFVIQLEMQELGLNHLPASTINRILKRNNLIIKRTRYQPSGKKYPVIGDDCPNSVHQIDIVGPRFIKGDGRFYAFNLIDVYSHKVSLFHSRSQEDQSAAQSLINAWKKIGKPEYLLMDNALYFHGSNRYPRSFGLVIRFCLQQRVIPVFAPIGEPWRRGVLEKFNDVYDKSFFRRQEFVSFAQLQKASQDFEDFHNQNHHYSVLHGKTPNQAFKEQFFAPDFLNMDFQLNSEKIPLESGQIFLLRFIRSDKILDVFGERFQLKNAPAYEYVVAKILVDSHEIKVYLDDKLIEEIYYPMPVEW